MLARFLSGGSSRPSVAQNHQNKQPCTNLSLCFRSQSNERLEADRAINSKAIVKDSKPIDMEVVETSEKRSQAPADFPSINDDVVGFEKDAEYIMKKLTGRSKELDVISIFGMAGLGKTTLARKMYNNTSIINHFDVKAWCTVSQTYNMRTLLVDILEQATNEKCKIKEDFDIADKLQKTLKGRRYLIVLDDMWKVEAWEDLGLCFPKGEDGSRVMVTTRIEEVAKHLQHHSDPYSLRFLTLEESWELLQKRVFQGESCPLDLWEAGLKVAEHCKGLPLVIVLIAGIIMKMEREASLLLEFANDLSSYVLGEQSMKVIQSSYEHLEDHLKHCLLYIALFPEDHKIPVHDLLKLWMAEEFVVNVDTENMEEASRFCLNNLLNRSLVMVSRRRINGDIECCTLHDVVREFCLRKLTEEKFMQLTVPYNPYDQHLCPQESRLCIYIHDDLVNQLDHYKYRLDKIPMLKSKYTKRFGECPRFLEFIAHPKFNTWNTWDRSNPLPLLVKLRRVRVLDIKKIELPSSWAASMQSLTHLRYLEIFVNKFDFKWISHLQELQTLVVDSYQFLRISPVAILKMMKLRHVNIKKLISVWEDNDRAIFEESSTTMLENLKTFISCRICLDEKNPRFWWRFPNLEELSLHITNDVPSCPLFPIPEVHAHLQSLDLVVSPMEYLNSVGWESYFVLPSNLRHLYIGGCFLTEEMVSNIARLQKLESLRLDMGFPLGNVEYCWDVRNVEFPALKYLSLFSVRMAVWSASDTSFPMLEKLVLKTCYYFKEIPPSFVDIPTFRLIQLFDCSDSILVSAMNIKTEIEENTGCDSLQVLISNTAPF